MKGDLEYVTYPLKLTFSSFHATQGDTALHIALKNWSLEVVKFIRTSRGAEELKSIRNKVLYLQLWANESFMYMYVLLQEGKTPDEITPEESEFLLIVYVPDIVNVCTYADMS